MTTIKPPKYEWKDFIPYYGMIRSNHEIYHLADDLDREGIIIKSKRLEVVHAYQLKTVMLTVYSNLIGTAFFIGGIEGLERLLK